MAALVLFPIIIIHLFTISRLVFFPYPELFIYPYLTNIGMVPYGQILDQHFPGLMFLPLNLGNLGMQSSEAAMILHMSIIIVTHIMLFITAKKLLKSTNYALVSNIFYLLWHPMLEGNVLWIDSFIPLMLLPALYFSYDYFTQKKSSSLSIAASLLGIAFVFKQVIAPLIALMVLMLFILRVDRRKIITFTLLASLPMIAVLVYIANIGVLSDFLYWTVEFNVTVFAEMGRKFATLKELALLFAILLPALLFIIWRGVKDKRAILATIFIIGTLMFAYARFDFVHLQPVLVMCAIGASLYVSTLSKRVKNILVMGYILVMLIPISTRLQQNQGNTVRFFGEFESDLVKAVRVYASEGDSIFTMGTTPHIYYLTRTYPAGHVFVFQFPWFMRIAEERILQGIKNDTPVVVVRDNHSTTGGVNLMEYMPDIDEYISENYFVVDTVGETDILIPND